MKLALFNRFARSRRAAGDEVRKEVSRTAMPEGPYTSIFSDWVAREVNPWLYEAIREAVAPIDGAIGRLVTIDGIIRVVGDNDRIVSAIEQWADNVVVNDLEVGLQAFYRSQGNEMYEQGFGVGEMIVGPGGVERLKVADSKGVAFRRAENGWLETWYRKPAAQRGRRDGTDQIERVLRNTYHTSSVLSYLQSHGYRRIDPARLVYAVFQPEADGPYGTSIMRSTEFDARVVLVMKNALYNTWERFGDPIFDVTYKTKAKVDEDTLERRRKAIAATIANAMAIKRSGNSADVVNAIGRDDELEIKVLGHDGQVLEIEMPARHVLESIVSKTGLPSWMLGFHWSTAERLAERQGEIALQESKTRFATRKPGLEHIVATHLRALGMTWKSGDWGLVQELPSLQDLVAQSQAAFLDAQTQLMLSGAGVTVAEGEEGAPKMAWVTNRGEVRMPTDEQATESRPHFPRPLASKAAHRHKAETYVEDSDALMRLERTTERALLSAWDQLYDEVLGVLGLDVPKAAKQSTTWTFDADSMLPALQALEDEFVASVGAEDADLARNTYQAWLRGLANAAAEFEAGDAVDDAAREAMRQAVAQSGLAQVRDTTTRALRDDIIRDLERGAYDGQNPLDVARALQRRFEAHEYDWQRLARSEIAQAQADGKLSQYAAHDVEQYDWVAAGNSCPICLGHERGGPYALGAGPVPMRDSHPNCRCTVAASVE